MGEVFISEMSGDFYLLYLKIYVGDFCLTVFPFQVHHGQYCSRFNFSSGSWTPGHIESAVMNADVVVCNKTQDNLKLVDPQQRSYCGIR